MNATMTQRVQIKAGDLAPDFTLKDESGRDVTLSSFRGKRNVVLVFYPLSFTSLCSVQMPGYSKDKPRYEDHDAQILGISVDSAPVHKAFAESVGVDYPLLADFYPHGAVAAAYGVFRPEGVAERATFVIDKTGVVRHAEIHDIARVPDRAKALEALKSLAS
ncbi:MAG TPA: peroxiredoxin [Candidatus Eisenbacteria bacterium]|nr:peroxiredoxin [Candidatus Eisenbacteria bacterium]